MCKGAFHGGPHSERARALLWPSAERQKYSQAQVRTAKRKAKDTLDVAKANLKAKSAADEACTDFLVTHIVNEIVFKEPISAQKDVGDAVAKLISLFVAGVLEEGLSKNNSARLVAVINVEHVLCNLCVEIIKCADELSQMVDEALNELAQAAAKRVVAAVAGNVSLEKPLVTALTAILKRVFQSMFPYAIEPEKIQFLRFLGVVSCPNIAAHRDVEIHCLKPLGKDWATDALKQWVADGFPNNAAILGRAKPRKKN
ncbi:hypothetical protein [uncultured Tessaracoccus sp.]|uniref:hypothetical protein n=1 Tax=uncultured Tessaracoccus sp. TaxID=905023 RepID=UPI002610E27B|nr:hypothetical protein [uncultured Tessaracoccus sp.]